MSSDNGTSRQIPAPKLRDTLDLGSGTLRKWIQRGKPRNGEVKASELRHTLDLGKSTIRNWISRGKIKDEGYSYVSTPGSGRPALFIDPHGLPPQYRQQWVMQQIEAGALPVPSDEAVTAHAWKTAADWRKEKARVRYAFYKAIPEALSTADKKEAIQQFKETRPKAEWPTTKGGSLATWYRYHEEFQQDGLAGLMPAPRPSRGTKVSDTDYDRFKDLYLTRDRRSARECWRRVYGAAQEEGRDTSDFPVPQTFVNLIHRREGEDAVEICRDGLEAFQQKHSPYVSRDWDTVKAGDVWFSDHRLFDQFVVDTRTGQVGRPWFTAWMDARSTMFLSWDVYLEHPNSDRIHLTLKRGIAEYGRPTSGYVDNGKDYRARDLTPGPQRNKKQVDVEMDELRTESLFELMGIDATFARPYNARAKVIERKFRYFIEQMEKFGRTYAGGASHKRPERTDAIVQAAKENPQRAAADGLLPTLWEFRTRVRNWVERINRTPSDGKILEGHSPKEIFYAKRGTERRVRPEDLGILCLRTSGARQIRRCEWKDTALDLLYTAEWMYEPRVNGTRAYARRDPKNPEMAWIFEAESGKLMGVAEPKPEVPAMIDPEENPEAADELARQMQLQQDYINHLKRKKKAIEDRQPSEEQMDRWYDAWLNHREEQRREEGSYLTEQGPQEVTFEEHEQAAQWRSQAEAQADVGTDDLPYEPDYSSGDGSQGDADDMKLWPDE